jgi:translation initiation factor 2 beta subunit (eIF-2beta)/eIF-5
MTKNKSNSKGWKVTTTKKQRCVKKHKADETHLLLVFGLIPNQYSHAILLYRTQYKTCVSSQSLEKTNKTSI